MLGDSFSALDVLFWFSMTRGSKKKQTQWLSRPWGPWSTLFIWHSLSLPWGLGPTASISKVHDCQPGVLQMLRRPGFPSWLCLVPSEILSPFPVCTTRRYCTLQGCHSGYTAHTESSISGSFDHYHSLPTWKFSGSQDKFSSVKGGSIVGLFLKLPALTAHAHMPWGKGDKHTLKSAAWQLGPKRYTTSERPWRRGTRVAVGTSWGKRVTEAFLSNLEDLQFGGNNRQQT